MIKDSERTWYYFGCARTIGHYLFDRNKRSIWIDDLSDLDGELCPDERNLYVAVLYRIPHLNYSSLGWWDQTVDTRPGSNSVIFAPSLTCSLESIRAAMTQWFPWVEARLPKPLIVLEGERTYVPHPSKNR